MDKPESSNPVYKNPNTPKILRKVELLKKIIDIRDELTHRKERLNYNIFAGINTKSITAQRKTITNLELELQILEHKYAYKKKKHL